MTTTTLPIASLETIERGDFITPTNQATKSLFKVLDKNHTPSGKVRLVLVNALTIDPKTSTVIPENNRHWRPRRTNCYAKIDPRRLPEWVSVKRERQTDGRFSRVGWKYDWSMFDSDASVIEPTIKSPFNFETTIIDPIRSEIDAIEKSMAMSMENKNGLAICAYIQSNDFTKKSSRLHACRSDLLVAEHQLDELRKVNKKT